MLLKKLQQIQRNAPLAFRLFGLILLASSIITLVAVLLITARDYHSGVEKNELDIQQIRQISVPGITRSVWNFDEQQLDIQLEALLQIPEISGLTLSWKDWNGNVRQHTFGDVGNPSLQRHSFPLIHLQEGLEPENLGTLDIYTSLLPLLKDIGTSTVFILLFQLIKTLLILAIAFYFANLLFGRYFLHILDYAKKLSLNNLDKPLSLDRPFQKDELQQLVDTINQMRGSLKTDIERRQKTETALLKEIQNRQQEATDRLRAEAESKAKDSFLATMSHEIRTPMSGIIGLLDLLDRTQLTNAQKHYVSLMQNASENLQTVLNDILDFAKIEAGKLTLDETDIDLELLLEHVLSTFAATASSKGIQLYLDLHSDQAKQFYGDNGRLRQVLLNLISNAIKFTHKGHVMVRAFDDLSQPQPRVIIEVEDTGIGIAPQRQQDIFNPFSQETDTIAQQYGGTGLGLTVCQHLVALMGGQITVNSQQNKGSVFRIELDVKKPQPKQTALLTNQHWLLISHDALLADALKHMLESQGASLQIVTDLSLVKVAHHYHHILIDAPFVHTADAGQLALIQKNLAYLSVLTDIKHANLPGDMGYHLLTKPVSPSQLRNSASHVNRHASAQDVTKYEYDRFDHLHVLVAEDNAINRDVIFALLGSLKIQPVICYDGKEAVETYRTAGGAFDLVLMDIEMPVMNGLDASRAIRDIEKAANLPACPIAALTAHVLPEQRKQMQEAGMNHFLGKPVRRKALVALLTELGLGRSMNILDFSPKSRNE